MVESGAVLCGKYRIEQVLGRGGMGVVARARHLDLDQPVAIKLLRPDVLQNRNAVERFRREARAMVQLRSEHVCRVFDVGTLDGGAHFMVMEYLEGKDLGLVLREQERLAPGFAVDLVLQACEALAEAHALGIVHRDIKPANCFLTCGPDGEPLLKVLDFGIAKALGESDDGITTSQAVIGSPSYMSPEQMRSSKHVDTRTDIWALGVVLYELVSGRRPFLGDSFAGLCLAVTATPMLPLDDVALPDGLAEIIARCLEKQPDQRFGSIAELSAALAPYAGTSAQGERSSTRTARMLERASSPALTALGAVTMTAGRPTRGSDGPRFAAYESTVTASAQGPTSTTARTTRPLPARPRRARQRRRWLLAAGALAVLAVLLALRVARGGGNWPAREPAPRAPEAAGAPETEPRALEPRALEPRALEPRAPEPRAPEPRALEPRALEPRALEPRALESRAPEPEPRAPEPRAPEPRAPEPQAPPRRARVSEDLPPASDAGGQAASSGRAQGERAASRVEPVTTPRTRRREARARGRRSAPDARPARERNAPAEAQRAAQPSSPAVDTWLDGEEFGSRQ